MAAADPDAGRAAAVAATSPVVTRPTSAATYETVGFVALLAVAALIRWWHLWDIPSPTDEMLGVGRGLEIARGEILPLTDFEPYIGAFWNYVLAAGFLLAGPSEYVGRAIPFVVGILTVAATLLLAREIGGPVAGWVAAVLLATSSAHTVATSHPAWSHCFSPLFATLGVWQLQRCIRRDRPRELLAAGGWLGLALQTHLTMLALLPGAGVFLLLKRQGWLRTPWPYLAAGIGVLLIGNILVFNLMSDLETVRRAETVQTAYARGRGTGAELLVGNLQDLGLSSLRTVSGTIDIREDARSYLLDPLVLVPNLIAMAGLLLLVWRGNPLPVLVIVSYLGLLVLFNSKYEMVPNGRFLTPVLPLAFAGSGVLLVGLGQRLVSRPPVALAGVAVVTVGLATISLISMAQRFDQMADSARTTAGLRAAVDALEAIRPPDEPILLDRNLDRLWLDGGGDVWMYLSYELTRRQLPVSDLPRRVTPTSGETSPCEAQRLILERVNLSRGTPRWLAPALRTDRGRVPQQFWTFRVVPERVRIDEPRPHEHVVFEYVPPLTGSSRAVNRCAPDRMI